MLNQRRAAKYLGASCLTLALMFLTTPLLFGQSAAKLLSEGSRYQAADDTSDRAADLYRQLIRKHPRSAQAESAQFFLAGYYRRKFFILEERSKVQDWESMNKAEDEYYTYIGKYARGVYLADAYHDLAVISLRRGYRDKARSLYDKMKESAAKDRRVYIFRFTWSPNTNDVIKRYCDTASLASASFDAIDKESTFSGVVSVLTNWARAHCR